MHEEDRGRQSDGGEGSDERSGRNQATGETKCSYNRKPNTKLRKTHILILSAISAFDNIHIFHYLSLHFIQRDHSPMNKMGIGSTLSTAPFRAINLQL